MREKEIFTKLETRMTIDRFYCRLRQEIFGKFETRITIDHFDCQLRLTTDHFDCQLRLPLPTMTVTSKLHLCNLQARSKKMPRQMLTRRHLRRNVAPVPSAETSILFNMTVAWLSADFFARMWFKANKKWAIYKAKENGSVRVAGHT